MLIRYAMLLLFLCGFFSCQEKASKNGKSDVSSGIIAQETSLQTRLKTLTEELEANPDNWALYEERSRVHYELGRLDWAIHDIREAIRFNDDQPELHYLRGFYALAAGDSSLALLELRLATGYGSANPDNYYLIGAGIFSP